ncbi:MAG: CBS domain-containing protein [Myxococcales bacterium]|nr:CBS domain-containing protein [Myxococcales bacterium]
MKLNESIGAVLAAKGLGVLTITPEATVYEAIKTMADHNVGGLVVMEGDYLLGVLSERDYTRKVALQGRNSKTTRVREILDRSPVTVSARDDVEDCMRLMTRLRVRHLPVMEGPRVVGIVSIGDLVNFIITAQDATIEQLVHYITGDYPV